ncbi:hypothetical protein AMTR_s00003p00270500 [Amborella trichopoda]|uniref:Major facilitator superfamily (MFS) profile domain-containing protein n=1 Tax=Amborella trichopoda TaxID=13333 RepID=W1P752_AMBTC|nr:hypothetical protein AMTR_s00003p00270500 [Amborella trichopoda]
MAGGGFVTTGEVKNYSGRMTMFVLFTCFVAATGGLILGYDIGISGGVTSMDPFLKKFFPSVYNKMQRDKDSGNHMQRYLTLRLHELFITIGILAANLVNYGTAKIKGGWGWRVSLALAAVPAAIITIGSLFLPDTPNSLIERGRPDQAHAMLKRIRGADDVKEEFQDLIDASEASKKVENPWRNIVRRKYRPQLVMALAIPFFQQLTGINVIMFYAPVLFKTIGFGSNASLMSAVITGVVNVVATFVSIFTVDRYGRRFLFLEGGIQMFISQVLIGILLGVKFGLSGTGHLSKGYADLVVFFICVYVAAFAWSWGPLGWLVPSEIFPLEIRSAGQSINVSTNLLFTFAIAQAFLAMLCHLKFGLFFFFAGWVFVMTTFIYFFLPETKNVPIEEMALVWRKHWFWRRILPHDDDAAFEMASNGQGKAV